MRSPENDDQLPGRVFEHPMAVGGDDPDFVLPTNSQPLVCAVPILRGMLPQCRSADSAQV